MAGDWSDAKERCKALTYAQAEERYNAGDIKTAQSLFASIPDYLDAMPGTRPAGTSWRRTPRTSGNTPWRWNCSGVFRMIIRKPAPCGRRPPTRRPKAAIRREDWTAAQLLGSLDREGLRRQYRDIENLYLQACEKAGINPYPETPVPPETTETPPAPGETPPNRRPLPDGNAGSRSFPGHRG